MTDGECGERHGVSQADEKARRRFEGAAGFVVTVDEDKRDDDE